MAISIDKMYKKLCQLTERVKDLASQLNTLLNTSLADTPICANGTLLGDLELEINRNFSSIITAPITGGFIFSGFIDSNNVKPGSLQITYNGSDLYENDPINMSYTSTVTNNGTELTITFTNLVTNPTNANPDWITVRAIELVSINTLAGCA